MRISDTTLLWSVLLVPALDVEEVRIVGLDGWAWRRGHKYGTIIVDLETRRVIDVLPDRCAESVQEWLEAHEEREIVSRDRGNAYIDGATQGAPLAQQVCDRWHLCKNIGDAVQDYLKRTRLCLPEPPPPERCEEPGEAQPSETTLSPSQIRQAQRSQALLARRQQRCEQVKALHALGWSMVAIHEHLGLDRKTIRKYLNSEGPLPPRQSRRRASILDPYYAYLLERWEQGCHNGQQLLREVRAKGYSGGDSLVELKSFVVGIERDGDAVEAALRLPWSQGPVEGHVNRLKTLKRQMYGKAGFALLRQRVLHRS